MFHLKSFASKSMKFRYKNSSSHTCRPSFNWHLYQTSHELQNLMWFLFKLVSFNTLATLWQRLRVHFMAQNSSEASFSWNNAFQSDWPTTYRQPSMQWMAWMQPLWIINLTQEFEETSRFSALLNKLIAIRSRSPSPELVRASQPASS